MILNGIKFPSKTDLLQEYLTKKNPNVGSSAFYGCTFYDTCLIKTANIEQNNNNFTHLSHHKTTRKPLTKP